MDVAYPNPNYIPPSSSGSSANVNDPNSGLVYDITDPFSYNPIDTRPPVTFPRIAGVVIFNGKCHAFTQQGTKIDMNQKTCYKVFDDRPFDYFYSGASEGSQQPLNSGELDENIS